MTSASTKAQSSPRDESALLLKQNEKAGYERGGEQSGIYGINSDLIPKEGSQLPVLLPESNQSKALPEDFKQETRHRIKGIFSLAVGVFFCLNLLLSFLSPFAFDVYRHPYKGWMWWTINDLRSSHEMHNIALLGSSLMVSAIACCEANHLRRSINLTGYHKASYLDNKLRTVFGGRFSTFNLSAPGQMPSDAYLSLKAMVNTDQRPEVVIYGIAPRDFIDSTLSNPKDTDHFRYLRRIVNVDDVITGLFGSIYGKLDWWLQKTFYLYGYSLDLQMSFGDQVNKYITVLVPKPHGGREFTWWDRVRLLPNYSAAELHDGSFKTEPMDVHAPRKWFLDNTQEYVARYKHPDPEIYNIQFYFLRRLARYCHRERIELVLVNMPLTTYNVQLLKPQTYFNYVQALQSFSINNDIAFIDLCDFSRYFDSDFHDSVHLNAFGGKKLVDDMVQFLSANQRTSSAMTMAAGELERHEKLAAREAKDTAQ